LKTTETNKKLLQKCSSLFSPLLHIFGNMKNSESDILFKAEN
jgi:hypothetical protein